MRCSLVAITVVDFFTLNILPEEICSNVSIKNADSEEEDSSKIKLEMEELTVLA